MRGTAWSTLLKFILGELNPESGNRVMSRGVLEARTELDDLHQQLSTFSSGGSSI